MPSTGYVLAIDQGTSSTKAVVVTADGRVRAGASVPLTAESPRPGWVEQDPDRVLASVVEAARATAESVGHPPVALALSSQRESALAWDPHGEPCSPVIGWQDRRTSSRAEELAEDADDVRRRTGLPLDPMFSALKFEWILDRWDADRTRARAGDLRLGTVDSFLMRRLTGTDQIELGNAGRTQVLNIDTAHWDDALCDLFSIPPQSLPPLARSNAAPRLTEEIFPGATGVPVAAVLGDSHAALFAHAARDPEAVKVTYGTGSSIMGLTSGPVEAETGLARTIAWDTGTPARAFEGNILATGATLVWLSSILDRSPVELAALARTVPDSGGVDLVPAFAGLGAPWWDTRAVGLISGFDLGATTAHLARAALESIPLQIEDVLTRADSVAGRRPRVYVDGGPAGNDWLMQRQADLSDRTVVRPASTGLSGIGAAYLAGLTVDLWDEAALRGLAIESDSFDPAPTAADHDRRRQWARALDRSRHEPSGHRQ
ncbi:FGGY family carbohydrate kinase [Pseudactinotalea sp. HY158]|uniref:FGGY family carbohydrate kinase n=1 Tax=Pseudactinotalea sp. HY158 TaxID=2654547 RepID=UPI00129C7C7E|nr:FGGY family carbohydrate kinase [Pseudactinotalea sp. HY158]QGH69709.1 glycerol kinase [Pseudactinotalea sp. HY158]